MTCITCVVVIFRKPVFGILLIDFPVILENYEIRETLLTPNQFFFFCFFLSISTLIIIINLTTLLISISNYIIVSFN